MAAKLLIFTILLSFWQQFLLADPTTSEIEAPAEPRVADSPKANLELALEQFNNKNYAGSAQSLRQLLADSDQPAQVHYNLFASSFADKKWGEAIFHLRQSLFLQPGLKPSTEAIRDLPKNFEEALYRKMSLFARWQVYWQVSGRSSWLLSLCLIFLGLALRSLLTAVRLNREEKSLSREKVLFSLQSLMALLFGALILLQWQWQSQRFASVLLNSKAKVTPSELSPELFELQEGELLLVKDQQEAWYNIEDMTGRRAWVNAQGIALHP